MAKFELQAPSRDGFIVPKVGVWSRDKHHFLHRYVYAFTQAMKSKRQWNGLCYVDLFAGAGIEELKPNGKLEWGSPLIALQSKHPFDKLVLCEFDREKFDALEQRISGFDRCNTVSLFSGDCNEKISTIVKEVPSKSLSLAFLDPYGLHLDFDTVRVLAKRRMDLIVFFPDHVDVLRNWRINYFEDKNSNLDRVLGPGCDWRPIFELAPRDSWPERIRNLFVQQLKKVGYPHFEYERINANNRPIYQLIFCSEHVRGAEIWRGISTIKPNQQRTLEFPE